MEKQELKSKWDDLARELGAEIPPETIEREQAVTTIGQEPEVPPATQRTEKAAAARVPLPKRPAAGWDNLAGELGLPPVEPVARAVEEVRPESVRETVVPPPPQPEQARAERPPQRDRGARRDRGERREPSTKRREPREHREKPERRRERPERQREKPVREREPREFDDAESTEPEREAAQQIEPSPTSPPREEPARGAAVSLWHKIFGSPAQQTAKLTEQGAEFEESIESSEREDRAPVAPRREEQSLELRDAAFDFTEDDEFDRGDEAAIATETEETPDERKRGRRRRRRGGRGRKSAERPTDSRRESRREAKTSRTAETDDEFDELPDTDIDEELPGIAADAAFDDDMTESEDTGETTSRSRAAQRTIPSWDEAIGFIVESNMQNRSQRRPPSRSGQRGRPRGRSRNG